MNIFRLALELFVIYIIYKFIFDFIIPVYRTTKSMKAKMAEMQERMNEQQRTASTDLHSKAETPKARSASDDYIEYEEIK